MPSKPRPKVYRATRALSVGGAQFAPGDVVTGAALEEALKYGDRFVTSKKPADEPGEKE